MKVIWNIDQTIAIPLSSIRSFDILEQTTSKQFKIIAHYVIYTGLTEVIYEADNKQSCIDFINDLYRET